MYNNGKCKYKYRGILNSRTIVLFLTSFLFLLSGCGGSTSGTNNNTPSTQALAQVSIDSMTVVPVINGSATKGTLYIHNYGTAPATGLSFGLNDQTTLSQFKSLISKAGVNLNSSLMNDRGFNLLNPELCKTIPAGGSCAINFSTPNLPTGGRGNSLVSLAYKVGGKTYQTNQVVNYEYTNLSSLSGVNFTGSLSVVGNQGSTQHVVGYLYGGGLAGNTYQDVSINSNSSVARISNGFINGQNVGSGQVIAVEFAVKLQNSQTNSVNLTPSWKSSTLVSSISSLNSGGALILNLTPSQNIVNYIFGSIPVLNAPTATAAVINVTNNGNTASSGALTAVSDNANLIITNNCNSTVLESNAANTCDFTFSYNGNTSGTTVVTFSNGSTTVGTQTVVWASESPVPAIYITSNIANLRLAKGATMDTDSIVFTLNNVGNAALSNVTYTPTNTASNGSWTEDSTTCTSEIAARSQCTISGHFTGNDYGVGKFYISASGSANSVGYTFVSLKMDYEVISAPYFNITTTDSSDLLVLANNSSYQTITYTVTNNGNLPGDFTAGNITISSNPSTNPNQPVLSNESSTCMTASSLNVGESCTIVVVYGPIVATNTTNESGVSTIDIKYNGGVPSTEFSSTNTLNYQLMGNDSSAGIGDVTANNMSGGDGSESSPFNGNGSLDSMTITIPYTNDSSDYAMDGFNLDISNLPYGLVVDGSSTCPTGSDVMTLAPGAGCNLVLKIDKTLLKDSASGGSVVLDFMEPTASWTTAFGFYSQLGSNVYVNYLQPTITFVLSNNNGNFESTVLTMSAVNESAALTLHGNVWGVYDWLESMPINPSSNCTVDNSTYKINCNLKNTTTGSVTYVMPNYMQAGESANIPLVFSTNPDEYSYLNPDYTFIKYEM